jgi:hypothetical protein
VITKEVLTALLNGEVVIAKSVGSKNWNSYKLENGQLYYLNPPNFDWAPHSIPTLLTLCMNAEWKLWPKPGLGWADAFKALKEGKRVTRKGWGDWGEHLVVCAPSILVVRSSNRDNITCWQPNMFDFNATDWEVVD